MIHRGGVVETQSSLPATFDVTDEYVPYVRFRLLSNPDAETLTQPYSLDDGTDHSVDFGDVEIGDFEHIG